MGTSEKQGLPKPPPTAMRKDGVPVNVTPLRDDPIAATQAFVRQKVYEKRSYLKKAFANPYNLSLLAGGLALSGVGREVDGDVNDDPEEYGRETGRGDDCRPGPARPLSSGPRHGGGLDRKEGPEAPGESFADAAGNASLARPGSYAGDHAQLTFGVRNSRLGLRVAPPDFVYSSISLSPREFPKAATGRRPIIRWMPSGLPALSSFRISFGSFVRIGLPLAS